MSADWALWGNNSQEYSVSARTTLSLLGTGVSLPFLKAEEFHSHSGTGGDFNRSVPAPSVIPVSFTATLGSRTGVQYNLDLWGESFAIFGFRECGGGYGPCGAIASAELTADYAHSLLWGGISSVTDANGNPVVLTSALGETGFNYMWAAQSPPQPPPIPEPSTVLLLGAGLMGLGVWGRKRMKG
ncbi:MAG: PEP-CTERM sorting domain-containing protein [Nitrospirae bacterium]|nr:PEP-CTERM sorting domain-containing protein [Nitrospirota bacterium]